MFAKAYAQSSGEMFLRAFDVLLTRGGVVESSVPELMLGPAACLPGKRGCNAER